LAAYNIQVTKLETERSNIDRRDTQAVAAFNARLEKSAERKEALDKTGEELNTRQKALLERLKPLAEEETSIDRQMPELTAKITALIKEGTDVQALLFGAPR
jgi:predicted transcriptional regulator